MIAVLLLDAKRGHGTVWAYVVAWVGAITVVLAALLAGFGAIIEPGSDGAAASVAELVLGLALLALGLRRILQARRAAAATRSGAPPASPKLPGWLRSIENISHVPAFLLGIYSATDPLVIAAAGELPRWARSLPPFRRVPRPHPHLADRAQPSGDHRHPARPQDLDHRPRPHRPGLISSLWGARIRFHAAKPYSWISDLDA